MNLLGVDTGGTFTDFILFAQGKITVHKVLSTPDSPERAILQGIQELDVSLHGLKLIHGSTVATNAVLEAKGVKTVYVGNYGLKDVLHIGRQAREALYDLQPRAKPHPLDRNLCLETGGRLSAQGDVIDDLSEREIKTLIRQIENHQPRAVAINLLFSFLNPVFEQRLKAALPEHIFVSCSSDILPEYKEYERGMTTWLNAYVGPLVEQYLLKLVKQIEPAKLSVMLSSGCTANAEYAGRKAVHMLLSGPAGGLQAAKYVGRQINQTRLLSFDMGGTSTDVAMIEDDIKLSNESTIANLPVAVAMVDLQTIGAGGGSIARVDEGNLLRVGPTSAGASPGPACYKNGGKLATVTDANVVLGRLTSQIKLGGSLILDIDLARTAIGKIAQQLNCSLEAAALGIVTIANEHMVQALRVISVHKGIDPQQYSLISFGGAGGLHACDLAESMGMSQIVVPNNAGVFSALGMLIAPIGRELSKTFMGPLNEIPAPDIHDAFRKLQIQGLHEMLMEGVHESAVSQHLSVDLRYVGQSFTLNIPWQHEKYIDKNGSEKTGDRVAGACIENFHATHASRYGHRLDESVELVNLRLSLSAKSGTLVTRNNTKKQAKSKFGPEFRVSLHDMGDSVPVWKRKTLMRGQLISGPALIVESIATTLVKPDWLTVVDEYDHLVLTKKERSP